LISNEQASQSAHIKWSVESIDRLKRIFIPYDVKFSFSKIISGLNISVLKYINYILVSITKEFTKYQFELI
jgi:hypothetical protein